MGDAFSADAAPLPTVTPEEARLPCRAAPRRALDGAWVRCELCPALEQSGYFGRWGLSFVCRGCKSYLDDWPRLTEEQLSERFVHRESVEKAFYLVNRLRRRRNARLRAKRSRAAALERRSRPAGRHAAALRLCRMRELGYLRSDEEEARR